MQVQNNNLSGYPQTALQIPEVKELALIIDSIDRSLLDTIYIQKFKLNFKEEIESVNYLLAHAYKSLPYCNEEQAKELTACLKNLSEILKELIQTKPFESPQKEEFTVKFQDAVNLLKKALFPLDFTKPERTVIDRGSLGNEINRICNEVLIHGKLYLVNKVSIESKCPPLTAGWPSGEKTEEGYLKALSRYAGSLEYVGPDYITNIIKDVVLNEVERGNGIFVSDTEIFIPNQLLSDLNRLKVIKINDTEAYSSESSPYKNLPEFERSKRIYKVCMDYLSFQKDLNLKHNLIKLFTQATSDLPFRKLVNALSWNRYVLVTLPSGNIECKHGETSDNVTLTLNLEAAVLDSNGQYKKYLKTTFDLYLLCKELSLGVCRYSKGYIQISPAFDTLEEMKHYKHNSGNLAYFWAYLKG